MQQTKPAVPVLSGTVVPQGESRPFDDQVGWAVGVSGEVSGNRDCLRRTGLDCGAVAVGGLDA